MILRIPSSTLRCSLHVCAWVLSLGIAGGCRQILDIEERSVDPILTGDAATNEPSDAGADVAVDWTATYPATAAQCGTLRYAGAECASCMDQACCAEATRCHDDPTCAPGAACFLQCLPNDVDCRARCSAYYGEPDALTALLACRAARCPSPCGTSCGGISRTSKSCDACTDAMCCTAASRCAQNAECQKLELCRGSCLSGSASCAKECQDQHPQGAADSAAWLECTQVTCGAECQPGRVWTCVDTPAVWPKPKSFDDVTFSLQIVDFSTQKSVKGVTVKACAKVDFDCVHPAFTTVADDQGLATLTVPVGTSGFDGFLDLSGGGIYPATFYLVPPVVTPGFRGRVQFASASDFPLLAAVNGQTLDDTRGHIVTSLLDCNFTPAHRVQISTDTIDVTSSAFYFVDGTPSNAATFTDGKTGLAGYVNLPAQLTLLTAKLVDQNRTIGSLAIHLRKGSITAVYFPPIPP